MNADERKWYFNTKKQWKKQGLLSKSNEKDDSNNADRQRLIQQVAIEVVSQIRDSIKADDEDNNSDIGKAILATLKARYIKITRVVDFSVVNKVTTENSLNAICDGGADSSMLGDQFKVVFHNDNETANVGGCIDGMGKKNLKIDTGVTAYDKDDGTTLLIVVNNAIDMTSQSIAILSSNQMRHRGVVVCDVHHKFTVGDRKGLFRIKVGNHELPLTMYNGLAKLTFRYPSDDELSDDTLEVIELTSATGLKPSSVSGNNFTPGADKHYYHNSGYKVNKVSSGMIMWHYSLN